MSDVRDTRDAAPFAVIAPTTAPVIVIVATANAHSVQFIGADNPRINTARPSDEIAVCGLGPSGFKPAKAWFTVATPEIDAAASAIALPATSQDARRICPRRTSHCPPATAAPTTTP